jgi:drug/metabolite transporter (DMT)-like permease
MIWTYFLNGEQFSIASVIGLALIVMGIFIQLTNRDEPKEIFSQKQ